MFRFLSYLIFLLQLLPYRSCAQSISTGFGENVSKPFVEAVITRGPYLQQATPAGITIRWRTSSAIKSQVRYGTQQNALHAVAVSDTATTEHVVAITHLQPATRYYYSISGSTEPWTQSPYYFETLPPAGSFGTYRIGVFGDCGRLSDNQTMVRNSFKRYIKDKPINAWILLGDNAYYRGTDVEFQRNFFDPYKDNLLPYFPFYPSPGNHDYKYRRSARRTGNMPYFQVFSMPALGEAGGIASGSAAYYSFDIGNIHFMSLDSYGIEEDNTRLFDTMGLQVQWLKKDLEAYAVKKDFWLVAYWHHPPYSMGTHNSDRKSDLKRIRKRLLPILERYGVDLVLSGHSHTYERSRLMKGHYGKERTFANKHILNNSSGRYNGTPGTCPYIKTAGTGGTVYVVTGSAGALGGRQKHFPHNAMYYSNDSIGGASLIEVTANKLTFQWISADGLVRDSFVMMKDVNKQQAIVVKKGEEITLTASFAGEYRWSHSHDRGRSITVAPQKDTLHQVKDAVHCLADRFKISILD